MTAEALNEFRNALIDRLRAAAGPSASMRAAATAIADRLGAERGAMGGTVAANPIEDALAQFRAGLAASPAPVRALAEPLLTLAPELGWYVRPKTEGTAFARYHANAEVIGPRGLEVRDDVIVGVSLMRPNVTYPDHHHPPEEVYYVLSEGDWRQNDDPWWRPGPGGYVYNPPNIVHAMRSGPTPLFAVWCLNPAKTH